MALVLYLEDNCGNSTSLEVQVEDDFQTFLLKAKSLLGHDVDISSIAGSEDVSLTDNVYQFLINTRLQLEIEETSADVAAIGDAVLPIEQQSSLLDDNLQEDNEHTVYILNEDTAMDTSHLKYVHNFSADSNVEYFHGNDITDDSISYIVYENEQDDDGYMYILDEGIIDDKLEDTPAPAFEDKSYTASSLNNTETVKLISDENSSLNSQGSHTTKANTVKTSNKKDFVRILKNFTTDVELEVVKINKQNQISLNNCVLLNENTTGLNRCSFCKIKIEHEISQSHIYIDKSKEGFHSSRGSVPKLICLSCLNKDYVAVNGTPNKLTDGEFLVIRNKVQKVFKKKTHSSERDTGFNMDAVDESISSKVIMNASDSTGKPPVVGYVCRICGMDLKELRLAIPHSVTHVKNMTNPTVFPCILCTNDFTQFQDLRQHMRSEHSLLKQKILQQSMKKRETKVTAHKSKPSLMKHERILEKPVKKKDLGLAVHKPAEVFEASLTSDTDDHLEMAEVEWLDEDTGLMVNVLRIVEREQSDYLEEGIRGEDQHNVSTNSYDGTSVTHKLQDHAYFEHENVDEVELSDSDSDSGVWIVQSGDVWLEGQDLKILPDGGQTPTVDDHQFEEEEEELQSIVIAPRMHQCQDCKKRYSTAERMARHVCHARVTVGNEHFESGDKMAGENGNHRCPFCDSSFHTKIRLQFHTRHFHLSSANGDDGESGSFPPGTRSLRCSMCPQKMFESEATLYDHVHFAHPRVRRHLCPEEGCGKAFHLKASLNNHIRLHAGERTHRCEVCGKQFFDRQTLGEHSVTHLKVKPFQCHICLKFLNRRSRLRMHLLTHESEPIGAMVLTCGNCDMAFKDAGQAEAHLNELGQCCESTEIQNPDSPSAIEKKPMVQREESFTDVKLETAVDTGDDINISSNKTGVVIQEGSDGFDAGDSSLLEGLSGGARKIINVVKIDKVYRCEYCEKVYSAQDALNVHRSCHEGLKNPFTCHICGATFSTYSRCTTHKTTHGYYRNNSSSHSEGSQVTTLNHDQFPVVKHFLCEVCGKSYLHWTYLQVHRRQKHSDNVHMYKCRLCGDEFPNSWGIAYHRKKVHGQATGSAVQANTPMPTIEKFHYSCTECGVVVKNKAQLLVHRRSCHAAANVNSSNNTKQGLYACMECGKRYITQVGLKGHLKSHLEPDAGGRPHRCEVCGKTFVHATGLTTHGRRVHMKETNFACSNCGKTFYSACDLQSHLRRHTGERPFTCDVCGHAFRTKGMRNEHLRIHTGERPYPCDICGLAFRRSYAMKNHRLIHTGERRYRCSLCPRAFRVRADLNTHFRHKHGSDVTVSSEGQPPVMVVDMPDDFAQNTQEEIHIDMNSMKTEYIEDIERRADTSGIIIFNEQGVESMLQNEHVLKLQKNVSIKAVNPSYLNSAKTGKVTLRNKEILSDINMMFEDSGDNVYVNDTQESIFLSDDGHFVIDNDTEIIGQLSVDGNSLIVMSKDGDERVLNVNDLQINSDQNVLLHGVTIETVDGFVEGDYNDEDLLPEGGSKFQKAWSDGDDSESGQVDDVSMDGSKSPDDARRFNELFSSSVANN